MIDFSGRTAVVSGAGAGIGRAIAEAYARLGAEVTGIEIDAARAAATGEAMEAAGLPVRMVVGDVRDATSGADVFAGVAERHGSLDILVNNVGDFLGVMNGFEEGTEAEAEEAAVEYRRFEQHADELQRRLRQPPEQRRQLRLLRQRLRQRTHLHQRHLPRRQRHPRGGRQRLCCRGGHVHRQRQHQRQRQFQR
jgi:NAD(P)-dependent dehydrogenase (short-subunit alcohol dehydrogenase family)